mgnify:CR=1 FL=1
MSLHARRVIAGLGLASAVGLSLGLGSAAADPETPTPTSPTQAAGTPGLQLTGGAAGGTPTVPRKQATGPAPSYAYVLDQLSTEFSRGSGAGQVANLLNQALTLRAQGFAPRPGDLMAVQAAIATQAPCLPALRHRRLKFHGPASSFMRAASSPGRTGPSSTTCESSEYCEFFSPVGAT